MKPSALVRIAATAAPVVAGALFLAAPVAPQAAMTAQSSADTVLPGYWEYTTSAVGVRDTETKCVRPSEIHRFFGGLSTRRWQCTYPVRQVGNGSVLVVDPAPTRFCFCTLTEAQRHRVGGAPVRRQSISML